MVVVAVDCGNIYALTTVVLFWNCFFGKGIVLLLLLLPWYYVTSNTSRFTTFANTNTIVIYILFTSVIWFLL